MFTRRAISAFDILKVATLALLVGLLVFLGSATRTTSPFAYFALLAILVLQVLEVLAPPLTRSDADSRSRRLLLRVSIAVQLLLASLLVAVTDGSGSIYELVFLLPIISAGAKLGGKEVVVVVGCAFLAMLGFIVADWRDVPTPMEIKERQDALSAVLYFTIAGLLTYYFAKSERDQRDQYESLVTALETTNVQLRHTEQELTNRLKEVSQMEERLQRVTQLAALGEVAGQMAHEIRNPLGIIKGATEMLARKVTEPSARQHLTVLLEEANRLNKAVEGVLRLSAPFRLQSTTIDLVVLLKKIVQIVSAWVPPSQCVMHFQAPQTPCLVKGDYDLLHQAFTNLVRNGIQAMKEKQGSALSLHIEERPDKHMIMTTITDCGVGLSEEDLHRLGEPFFSKSSGGIGLGFSLANRIIKEHGGSIEVESELAQGTSVLVQLPAFTPTVSSGLTEEASLQPPKGR